VLAAPPKEEEEEEAEEEGPLHRAAASGDVDALSRLLGSGGVGGGGGGGDAVRATDLDLDARDGAGRTPLHRAAGEGHAACVSALLRARADAGATTAKGNSPLALAAKRARHDAAAALLEGGAEAADVRALLYAARRGAEGRATAALLAARGALGAADAKPPHPTALMLLAGAAEANGVALLLELQADPAARDARGCTALHHAAADRGDAAVVAVLLDAGAPLDAADRYGNTALHGAGRCGRAEAFELLLARGADAEQLNERGRPPKLLEAGAESCSVM
jgi:ankyrin repeat protein